MFKRRAGSHLLPGSRRVSTMTTSTIGGGSETEIVYTMVTQKVRDKNELDKFREEISMDDHEINLRALVYRYGTDLIKGLTMEAAAQKLIEDGPNALIPPPTKPTYIIFLEYLFGNFNMLLWMGAILSVTGFCISYYGKNHYEVEHLYLAIVLVIIIFISGMFGFCHEYASNKIIDSFKHMIPKEARVTRNGVTLFIPCHEIVLGDLVHIKMGEMVPADIRIIECYGLKVDNSSITGESQPQTRSTKMTDPNPLETKNLAFFGTNVVEGSGSGIVVACGDNTLMGRIAGLTTNLEAGEAPIKKDVQKFIKLVTFLAFFVGTTFFFMALTLGYNVISSFLIFIAMVIANVPEGLVVTLTACLTITAKRMKDKNCLVKDLQAVETLGCTNVICSDKTGTLTENRMTVSHIYYNGNIVDVLLFHQAEMLNRKGGRTFNALCLIGVLCSKARFEPFQKHVPVDLKKCAGDASEVGILRLMEKIVGDVVKKREEIEMVAEIPFNSTNKYHLCIYLIEEEPNSVYLLVMKGAPERILARCSTIAFEERDEPLDEDHRSAINRAIMEMGYLGERVIAFADCALPISSYPLEYKFNTEKLNFPTKNLRFVGLMSMLDPPRKAVPESVEICKNAGIRVVMVTGDHPMTAMAIARKVGIISLDSETIYDIALKKNISTSKITAEDKSKCQAIIVTGQDLRNMKATDLEDIIINYPELVFARTSPQQKLRIVEAFQSLGNIVAVTGDGVNDSPALKKADIGVAMGIAGTEVTKEAAKIILLDDNFSSIVMGVEEGRLIFDNLKKSLFYVLTSNIPEIAPFVLHLTIGIPLTTSVMSILLINVGTDLVPSISLVYERKERDLMKRKPRDPHKDNLVNYRLIFMTYFQIGVIQTLGSFSCFFVLMANHGFFWDRLIGIRNDWYSKDVNNLKDSYDQEWTYEEREILTRKAIACYFLSIVVTQVADLLICKTRKLSLFQQGMTNWVLNFSILFELIVAGIAVFTPGLNEMFQFEVFNLLNVLPVFPFAIFIFAYDELRKLIIRHNPDGWVYRETYY